MARCIVTHVTAVIFKNKQNKQMFKIKNESGWWVTAHNNLGRPASCKPNEMASHISKDFLISDITNYLNLFMADRIDFRFDSLCMVTQTPRPPVWRKQVTLNEGCRWAFRSRVRPPLKAHVWQMYTLKGEPHGSPVLRGSRTDFIDKRNQLHPHPSRASAHDSLSPDM